MRPCEVKSRCRSPDKRADYFGCWINKFMSASIHSYTQRQRDFSSYYDKWLENKYSPYAASTTRRRTYSYLDRYDFHPSGSTQTFNTLNRSALSSRASVASSSVYRSRASASPAFVRRTYTGPITPIQTMSNLRNVTQRDSKASLTVGGMSTSYRDSYQPWKKPLENGLEEYNSSNKLYKGFNRQRSSRDVSVHSQNAESVTKTPSSTSSYSRYRSTPANSVQHRVDRVPTTEFSSLNLNGDASDAAVDLKVANRTECTSAPVTSTTTLNSSVQEQSPTHSRTRSSPVDESSVGTSNSSNNSSAPRWSNGPSLSNPSALLSTRSNLISDSNRRRNGGMVGLNNLGNTCFMNSILQCLSNTTPLLEYCLSGRYTSELNKSSSMHGNLFASYVTLMRELWDPEMVNSSTSPHQFKTQIQRFAPRFVGYAQQDSQEFLRYLLEGLHMDVNRVTKRPRPVTPDYAAEDRLGDHEKADIYWRRYLSMDNSEIVDIFVGQLMSTLECAECGFKSTTFDPFWDLSLPIPKKPNVSLMDCLKLFTAKEDLDGNERPVCGRCKVRRRCSKSFSIQKFPRILVLHLKRFSGERFRSKMSLLVDYPVTELNMTEFASPSCPQKYARYSLYAVSNHSGSVYAGHYTAACRHPYLNTWFDYNDSRVRSINSQSVVSPEGYVLFYELSDYAV
ncbi:unnamed protein product [Calicophoron daubneyi]|uniref:Ubiquitin carboxyl-terminal hydrolase n=1 Tax=Calicophoron daubneyi TaxID=300641 RepID=A0AAV2TUK0_CALDB